MLDIIVGLDATLRSRMRGKKNFHFITQYFGGCFWKTKQFHNDLCMNDVSPIRSISIIMSCGLKSCNSSHDSANRTKMEVWGKHLICESSLASLSACYLHVSSIVCYNSGGLFQALIQQLPMQALWQYFAQCVSQTLYTFVTGSW